MKHTGELSNGPAISRKSFLLGVPALAGLAQLPWGRRIASAEETNESPERQNAKKTKTEAFVEQVVADLGRTYALVLGYLGDRLGLFKTMAARGPLTAERLAEATDYEPRLLEEWLNGMVAAEYVTYDPGTRRYRLPPEHADVLADEESPSFFAGFFQSTLPLVMAVHEVERAFRTGQLVTPDVFHESLWEGIARASAPGFKHQLVQQWLQTMPDVTRKLEAGGSAADIGCGGGLATVTIARAFPKATAFGYDLHQPSIERAKGTARAGGVAERAKFVVGGTKDLPAGSFDLITSFYVVHHFSDPVSELTAVRRALKKDGSYLVMEDNISENVLENRRPWSLSLYGASLMYCLHDSLAHGGAGLGAEVSEPRLRRLAREAGFTRFRRLPLDDPYIAIYELKP